MCRQDHGKAVEILGTDLKVFAKFNEDLYKEITMLLTLGNFRYAGLLRSFDFGVLYSGDVSFLIGTKKGTSSSFHCSL